MSHVEGNLTGSCLHTTLEEVKGVGLSGCDIKGYAFCEW